MLFLRKISTASRNSAPSVPLKNASVPEDTGMYLLKAPIVPNIIIELKNTASAP